MKKLDDALSSDNIKCIILEIDQNAELYKKYNKIVVQFDSENWTLNENFGGVDGIFIDKYSKMINQLNVCK